MVYNILPLFSPPNLPLSLPPFLPPPSGSLFVVNLTHLKTASYQNPRLQFITHSSRQGGVRALSFPILLLAFFQFGFFLLLYNCNPPRVCMRCFPPSMPLNVRLCTYRLSLYSLSLSNSIVYPFFHPCICKPRRLKPSIKQTKKRSTLSTHHYHFIKRGKKPVPSSHTLI